ncbi:MAG: hypothetical protein JWP96_53 [Polaromonas sp.]|nr:hypothetical protein [Polaromonas sp.]
MACVWNPCCYPFDKEFTMTSKHKKPDHQEPHTGKVENDSNKMGEQKPTQKNEGRRTPESRHDRESHIGSTNVIRARKGGAGGAGSSSNWH